MEQVHYWLGIFWSPAFYARALRPEKSALGFLALGMAAFIIMLSHTWRIGPFITDIHAMLSDLPAQLPAMVVENGKVRAELPNMPYTLEYHTPNGMKNSVISVLIDTTRDRMTDEEIALSAKQNDVLAIVTAEYIYTYQAPTKKFPNDRVSAYRWDNVLKKDQRLTSKDYAKMLTKFAWYAGISAIIIGWSLYWTGAILLALVLGFIGNAAKPKAAASSGYVDLVRVGSYSLVPLMLISAAFPLRIGVLLFVLAAILHYLLVLQLAKRALPPESPAI